jgi:bacterioferritin-associated ferredoxin
VTSSIIYHCYCTGVTQKRVLRAMVDQGVRSVDDIRRVTGACTGCQSCRRELESLITAVADGCVRLPAAEIKPA